MAEIVEGKVLTGLLDGDDQATACQVALARVLTDYVIAVDGTNANQVHIRSPVGETFSFESATSDGAGGTISVSPGEVDAGTPGVGAYARFTITGAPGGSISQIKAPGAVSGTVNLFINTVNWTTDAATTATLVAQEINRSANEVGYTADGTSGVVTIYAPATLSAAYINAGQIEITHNGMTFTDTGTPPLKVTLSAYAAGQEVSSSNTVLVTTTPITGYPAGGTGTYTTYQWQVLLNSVWTDSDASHEIYALSDASVSSAFAGMKAFETSKSEVFRLKVIDSGPTIAYSPQLLVTLSNVVRDRPPVGRYEP